MENKVINQLHMREMNLNEVLKIIREQGPLTRRKLQDLTGLSWGGVSQIVTRLLNQNLIIEEKDMTQTAGRKPTCLKINGQQNLILGIDINSSGITAVIQNLQNEVLEQITGTADCTSKEGLLTSVYQLADELYQKYKDRTILAMGISMQSAVDEQKGLSLYLKECPGWKDVPLCEIFTERYEVPVYLAHDPDCLVASNVSMFGEDVILFRIDYGIGMSVFKNGDFIKAPGMLEIGNTLIQAKDRKIQTLNSLATISAIEKKTGRKIQDFAQDMPGKSGILQDAAGYLAMAITNSAVLFDISTVLLSGKLIEQVPEIFTELQKNLKTYLPEQTRIFKYDEKRAAAGAAWIAAERQLTAF
ncbi:ROK family protein [Blautia sp. MSJ-19]|uniref:ROK family protein n=1 Tax=Blautia sp. MSJ-19 TaxID=2841517 RepID=UPI001C0EEB39|nr:ROK family protein [Blautia sp. MSJ-19]MBU5480545.1 ROK family protein [Blautia sp. MSJ-19]